MCKYNIPHSEDWQEIIKSLLKNIENKKVLDIPAGNLWLSKILLKNKCEVFADDICFMNITEKMKNIPLKYNASNLENTLPYPNEFFDYVFCFEGIEHISNTYVPIREFHRILKKDGTLFISFPNTINLLSRMRFLLFYEFIGYPLISDYTKTYRHLHINPISPPHFFYILHEIGFDIINIVSFDEMHSYKKIFSKILAAILFLFNKNRINKMSPHLKTLYLPKNQAHRHILLELKKSKRHSKTIIGDYGYYPSLDIY